MTTTNPSALSHARVRDAMHVGIISTDPSTPVRVVARLMAKQRVHAVAVNEPDRTRRPWRIVTAADIVSAALSDDPEATAGSVATEDVITVTSDEYLDQAARIMSRRGVEHVIVVDPSTAHPVGIVSSLDIAALVGD